MLRLSESTSEHLLAKAIIESPVIKETPINSEFKLSKFKNLNGEGIIATVKFED